MTLYELPDGSWVKPSTITAIVPKDRTVLPLGIADHPPRVIVQHNGGFMAIHDCKTFGEAKELCALIAKQINEILDGEKGDP